MDSTAHGLYGVEPVERCEFTRAELERIRKSLPGRNETLGPRTPSEAAAFARTTKDGRGEGSRSQNKVQSCVSG